MKQARSAQHHGFTTVELLVTLFVAVAFLSIFYQLFIAISQGNARARHMSIANNIASGTLSGYQTISSLNGFVCNSDTDLTSNPSANGQELANEPLNDSGLPSPATRVITAFAPHGCDTSVPVRVNVDIIYGNQNTKVTNSAYVRQ